MSIKIVGDGFPTEVVLYGIGVSTIAVTCLWIGIMFSRCQAPKDMAQKEPVKNIGVK
jgi:hypothetical protein